MNAPVHPGGGGREAVRRAWFDELAGRLGARDGAGGLGVAAAAASVCEAAGPGRAWTDEALDRLLVQACCAAGERETARDLLDRRYPGRPARNTRWLAAAEAFCAAPPLAALARAGLLAALPVGRDTAEAWRIDLGRLCEGLAGGWELAVWPSLGRLLDALAAWAEAEGRPLLVGLAGTRELAVRWTGSGRGRRARALRDEVRRFCARRLARRTGRPVDVRHVDIAR